MWSLIWELAATNISSCSILLQGTSTACILVLEDNKLHAANLGDSGFIVIREQKVVFKSPSQQHRFNFPYQLGCPGTMSDLPEHAEVLFDAILLPTVSDTHN